MNILLYTSFNERSIAIESILLYFKKTGNNVFLLTTCSKGAIHAEMERSGINCFGTENSGLGHLKAIRFLIKFCKENNVDVVHSHLQLPNFYALMAKAFIPSKIITVRHNSDVIHLFGTSKQRRIERIVNTLSPCIVAISDKVKNQLIQQESVDEKKVVRINNGYDFSRYEELGSDIEYEKLKHAFAEKFLILSPGRLMASKRHHLCIEAMPNLLSIQSNCHLIVIGDGPEEESLNELIEKLSLKAHVTMVSYKENISDYIKLANVVVQLSISEASNNSVKEAAYFEKPCIVCRDVGDFSDYITHGVTGFLVDKNSPKFEFIECMKWLFSNKQNYGGELKKEVLSRFEIARIGREYDELHKKIGIGK